MPVRIVSIKRSGQLHAEIMGLEYIPEIYEDAEEIPEIDYALPAGRLTNITVNQYQDYLGDALVGVSWSWTGARAINGVRISVDNEQVGLVRGHENSFSFNVDHIPEETQIVIRLEALDDFGNPIDTKTVLWTIEEKAAPPNDVVWGECSFIDKVVLRWNAVTNYDLLAYEVRTDENFGSDNVGLVYRGDELSYVIERPTQRSYTFYIKALNRAGVYSRNATIKTLENPVPSTPPQPIITEFFSCIWVDVLPVADNDIINYNVYLTPCDEHGNPTGDTIMKPYPAPQRVIYQAPPGSSYLIQVAAEDILGEGEKSAPVIGSTRKINEENIRDHFEAGSIEAYIIASEQAFIDSAKIINLDASKITVGDSSAPIPLAIQPGDTLFRFDGSLLSTQGLKPIGME